MKCSFKLLVLMLLVFLPVKASALSCVMISIAESCDMLWGRPSGLDYNLCLESRKKQKMDEQAIESEWRRLVSEKVMLLQRLEKVSLSFNSELQIENALRENDKRLVILSPIYEDLRATSCLK
jgi:hypothetical protein